MRKAPLLFLLLGAAVAIIIDQVHPMTQPRLISISSANFTLTDNDGKPCNDEFSTGPDCGKEPTSAVARHQSGLDQYDASIRGLAAQPGANCASVTNRDMETIANIADTNAGSLCPSRVPYSTATSAPIDGLSSLWQFAKTSPLFAKCSTSINPPPR